MTHNDGNENHDNALAHRENRVERIERFQALQPGTYWRVVNHEALRGEVKEGSSFRDREPRDIDPGIFDADTVYLLKRIEYADGEPHTVQVLDHPGKTNHYGGPATFQIRLQPFLNGFHFAPDAEQVREHEIAAVQQRINDKREEVERIAADPTYVMGLLTDGTEGDEAEAADTGADELDAEAGLPDSEAGSQSIARAASADRALIERQVNNSRVIAKAQANLLKARTGELEATVQALTPYYSERAAAAKASVSDVMDQVERIEQGLMTLGLYTGEQVQVLRHVDGEGAAPDEPLTLRQRLLFMDEESLVNVAEGGADFEDLDTFVRQLAADADLRARVIPEPRAVVAVQYRRKAKHYEGEDAMAAMRKNELNRTGLLLVRDGGRLHTVHSPLESLTRLFPTRDEADAPFKGVDGEAIRIDDVRFPKAKHASEMLSLHYKRLLILLWGLYDREDLFGRFRLEDERGHLNLLSADVQNQVFRFVYDDEDLLGDQEHRPDFRDFVVAKNRFLQSGSRVACAWRPMIDPDTAPACAKAHEGVGRVDVEIRYVPVDGQQVMVAETRGGTLCVRPRVTQREPYFEEKPDFNATVRLPRTDPGELTHLCLDDVRPEDIDWYVHSRRERQQYLGKIPLLVAARERLLAERPTIEAFTAAVRETLALAGLILPDDRDTNETIADAIRAWRASKRGALPPDPGEDAHRKALEQVVGQLWWQYAEAGRQRITDAEALCKREGREPLRLVVDGQGRLYLYAGPHDDEREERFEGHVWVQRLTIAARKTKFGVDNRSWVQLAGFDPAERVIAEWPGADTWSALERLQHGYDDVARAIEGACMGREWLIRALTEGLPDAEWDDWFNRFRSTTERLSRSREVITPTIAIPIGVVRADDRFYRSDHHAFVTAQEDLLVVLHRIADERQRERLHRWVRRTYAHEDTKLASLDRYVHRTPGIRMTPLQFDTVRRLKEGPRIDNDQSFGPLDLSERGHLRALLTGERYGEAEPDGERRGTMAGIGEFRVERAARKHRAADGLPVESAEELDRLLIPEKEAEDDE